MSKPVRLPLTADEMPDVTDAGVGLTLLMVASLLAERERQALHGQMALAFEARDWDAVAAVHRRLAAVPPAVPRMADVARAGIDRFDAGQAEPGADPADNARARRALVRSVNWLDKRFWKMYGAVRPIMPPADDAPPRAPTAAAVDPAPARQGPEIAGAKPCRKKTRGRLYLVDDELARIANDARPAALTARRILTADRNAIAGRCRACGGCRLAGAPITLPLPTA